MLLSLPVQVSGFPGDFVTFGAGHVQVFGGCLVQVEVDSRLLDDIVVETCVAWLPFSSEEAVVGCAGKVEVCDGIVSDAEGLVIALGGGVGEFEEERVWIPFWAYADEQVGYFVRPDAVCFAGAFSDAGACGECRCVPGCGPADST
jgi:hypothetical protein